MHPESLPGSTAKFRMVDGLSADLPLDGLSSGIDRIKTSCGSGEMDRPAASSSTKAQYLVSSVASIIGMDA